MRQDLSHPQQVVQACHAAIEAARFLLPSHLTHPHLVVCGVPGESDLYRCIERFRRLGVEHRPFREPDRGGELTALATGPIFGSRRRIFRRYRCLGAAAFGRLIPSAPHIPHHTDLPPGSPRPHEGPEEGLHSGFSSGKE